MHHTHRTIAGITAFVVLVTASVCSAAPAATSVGDSVYAAHHPSLMFTPEHLGALRARVVDGGDDDDAYNLIYLLTHTTYADWSPAQFLSADFGMQTIPNVGLVAWIEEPFDSLAMELGRAATLYLAGHYAPDYDEANTGLRLRTLVLGYDLFFGGATESERQTVIDEIVQYLQLLTSSLQYDLFAYRPYLGNHSAMFAGPLGMAAVSLRGQVDDELLDEALADADRICERLIQYQIDPAGSYKEGAFYGLWTMKNLVFYFDARKRYDGFSYADVEAIRRLEESFAFELLPEGGGFTNNLNDTNYATLPYLYNTAYFDWAIHEWDSGLSSWIWEHVAGEFGIHNVPTGDNATTVLWHDAIAPIQPDSIVANHALWLDRGLYYYRTGWHGELRSEDVVFSFFSGKFHGGHAQEDQNQFTLYAYGDKYAIDHGSGTTARQSEAHNMVFIDGAGQHNAGSSIGTDGEIAEYLLGEFADYIVGDATAAYSTYSEFNRNGYPLPSLDWSWGHKGANPVVSARRRVLIVHGPGEPWFVIADDIEKDGQPHQYEWRMHTRQQNIIDTSTDPLVITGTTSALQVFPLNPPRDSLEASVSAFNNYTTEPDATVLSLSTTAVDPHFAFLLIPVPDPSTPPTVTRTAYAWGQGVTIDRGGGVKDVLVFNPGGAAASHERVDTDAALAVLRVRRRSVLGFFTLDATTLTYRNALVATTANGPMTCSLYNGVVDLDRYDADYRIADLGVTRVRYREQELGFSSDGDYVVPDGVTGIDARRAPVAPLEVRAYPNPFNPRTTIRVHAVTAAMSVDVFDVTGRRVRQLYQGPADGPRDFVWDGLDDGGNRVASGVYLVRVQAGSRRQATKVIAVK